MRALSRCRRRSPGLLLALLLVLGGCGPGPGVEEQIRETISSMESAAEEGRPIEFMGYVADDFQGRGGQMTRDDFLRFMTFQMNRYRRFQATLFPIEVNDQGGNFADASFRVLVTGGRGLLPENGQLYTVETSWVRDDGDWRLWRADWTPVLR